MVRGIPVSATLTHPSCAPGEDARVVRCKVGMRVVWLAIIIELGRSERMDTAYLSVVF